MEKRSAAKEPPADRHRALLPSLLVLFVLLVNGGAAAEQRGTKTFPITTLVNAKWGQTPLYLEIAEYLADENPGLYWDYVKILTERTTPIAEYETASQRYNAAIDAVRPSLSDLQLPLLKLVVSMHSLTPRIQTHFQLAAEALRNGACSTPTKTFVQIGGQLACSYAEVLAKLNEKDPSLDTPIETYAFDHIYPGTENSTRTAILYGDLATREFAEFHRHLLPVALAGRVRYIARHYLEGGRQRRVRLSGYGVELHLKSTEYKSQDDAPKPTESGADASTPADEFAGETEVQGIDFTKLKERLPTLTRSLEQLRQNLLQGHEEIAQLKAWEFQDLGLQATAAIAEIEGDQALQILQFTAHNFPLQARSLLGHKVSAALRDEVKHNTETFGRTLNIVPPDGALFVNGLFFDADTLDLGALVETLRSEVRVLETLHANRIRGPLASAMLALDLTAASSSDFAIDIRDTAIKWINDIETDPQYRRWPSSVMDLLRPTFPGMLRNIRKNVFNLVLVVDPVRPEGRALIKLAESFVLHLAPVRLGLVFDERHASTDTAIEADYFALVCAFNYVTLKKDARAALSFLTDVFAAVSKEENVRRTHIRAQLRKTFPSLKASQVDEILDVDSDFDYGRQLAQEFVERLGFVETPQALLNGVPMQTSLLRSDGDFEEAIFSEIMQQTAVLQKAVYRGDFTDADPVLDYLMNQPHVLPRLNQRILATDNARYLDLSGTPQRDLSNVRGLALLSNRDMTATLLANLRYFGGRTSAERIGGAELHFQTLWLFGDLTQPAGRQLLINGLRYLRQGGSVRLAFIPNTEGAAVSRPDNLNRLVWAAMQTLPGGEAADLVLKWLRNPSELEKPLPPALNDVMGSTELHLKMLRVFAQRTLQLGVGDRMVIGNGKIFGPLGPTEQFDVEDFALIERFNALQYGDKIRKVLQQNGEGDSDEGEEEEEADSTVGEGLTSDTLLRLFASLVPRQSKTRFRQPTDVKEAHSVVRLQPKDARQPHFNIAAVVDPASRSAQRLAPILILLRQILNCEMRVFLIPLAQHSDMPVKSFYRYVIESEVHFAPNGEPSDGPQARFVGVPANPLLTQNLQVPESWLVEAVRAVYDLDNIRLGEIGGPVHSEYELEYLLLEGHCFDATSGAPPRGLQIVLGTKEVPSVVDTIVMANLGYFQLKANPGAWQLRLRDGKSADIYEITHAEGPNTVHQGGSTTVVISSLRSHVIKLRVAKRADMQNVDLLGEDDDEKPSSGIWSSIANSFGGGGGGSGGDTAATDASAAATINIFSVASGHLYERLLRIMMLSLLKHTQSPVKFWFLKNYLSPQFTDFLPAMAQEYNFQYELVQYKWPRWLHQQTEKQRTIWGYKILFLDVLFPLNVRKIVFVDADAIVRADLRELYDMDLGGAPYAYTPFCDSRKDMDGYRFWKTGYWRSHLMGRRYHISALYVVDLRRFRRIAAGDRLRGQYQALSQDPNSLANLDQDLPNNMIHQVAIKSLPDEWLWCQTWCSDSSFKAAKVIDLCNNPLTKEAKLTAAQRIVPEWSTYDAEIKTLLAKIEERENSEHAHILPPGVMAPLPPAAAEVDDEEALPPPVHSEL